MKESLHRQVWATISASALARNVSVLRTLSDGAAICAVIKANGYGHDAVIIATLLQETGGADYLAVATVDESMELRGSGITMPVLVLGECSRIEMDLAIANDVGLSVGSLLGAQTLLEAVTAAGRSVRVHLKVDTGMHRQGVLPEQALEAAQLLQHPLVDLEGVFTHFPVADGNSADDDAFTRQQITQFREVVAAMAAAGITPRFVHSANSAALLRGLAEGDTMVRPGLSLYGYAPEAWIDELLHERGLSLRPVLSLQGRVSALRRVRAGARPSYGRRRAVANDATIITIPIGYADGFPRRLFATNQTVLVKGQRFSLAGQVAMDQIVVNVGDLDVAVGDEVVLLGPQGNECIDISEWATRLDTITWEVLCDLGARVPRVLGA